MRVASLSCSRRPIIFAKRPGRLSQLGRFSMLRLIVTSPPSSASSRVFTHLKRNHDALVRSRSKQSSLLTDSANGLATAASRRRWAQGPATTADVTTKPFLVIAYIYTHTRSNDAVDDHAQTKPGAEQSETNSTDCLCLYFEF